VSPRPDGSSTALAALLSLALHGAVLAACLTARPSGAPESSPIAVVLVSAVPGDAPEAMPETAPSGLPAAEPTPVEATSAPPAPMARPAVLDKDVAVKHSRTTVPVPRSKPRPPAAAIVAATTAPQTSVALAVSEPSSPSPAVETAHPSVDVPITPEDAPITPEAASGSTTAERTGPAGAGSAPPAALGAREYFAEISAALARHQRYPEGARRRGEEGTVLIAFALDRAGHVLSFDIRKRSGNVALDRAAEEMVRDADPLPPAPPSYPGARIEMTLPVLFNLKK
jgi:protein TonB